MATEFKRCSCGASWISRDLFLRDPHILPIGMTFVTPESFFDTYYFFNHTVCGTSLAMSVLDFSDLIPEQIPPFILAGTKECPGHCTSVQDLEECQTDCRNAPFRRLLLTQLMNKKH